ncbi:acyl-CoA dehydrogenase family protein [Aliiglaciecola sp. CAU 1673]|uniref:acyl-CoA dehydrogenase family protein n=1 Tax=Aliiglaciecola sp. CAU 1673 TaxID=3032595 RepID=UPI0023DAE362|nr:acyl-CoA dehydrogenase family protein [Aliiglaciecola sp. CAU 1673]MDF2178150.1 acyl-CoA dehydrogenase family protein [Aliiglaciecola sp. CAU 1673]
MNPMLDDQEVSLFRDTVRGFMQKEVAPHYEQWEKDKCIPKSFWLKMGEQGMLCADIPEEYGGIGTDFRFNMVVIEEASRAGFAALATNLTVHSDICAHYILNMGNEAQKHKYLPKMVSGECIGAICMTEPGAGSDLQGMKTNAVKNGNEWRLNGSKTFITNGQNASLYIVAARTNLQVKAAKGLSLFLVDGDKAGFQRGQNLHKMGQHAADTSELFFEDVILSDEDILGPQDGGFIALMQELPRERLALAVGAVSHAEGALYLATQYVKERQAFGGPLTNLQSVRFSLAEMATQVELHKALNEKCKGLLMEKALSTELASMAKYAATDMECKVIDQALQLFGGYGYMQEYPISRFYVDARVQRIYGGTNEIMKEIISRKLVAD